MTNEELAVAAKCGDEQAIDQLWDQTYKFIKMQAEKRARWWEKENPPTMTTADDLIQVGYFALLKAIKYYNPDREFKFITYLNKQLLTEFSKESGISRGKKDALRRSKSLDAPLEIDDSLTLADTLADPDALRDIENIVDEDFNTYLHELLDKAMNAALTEEERRVIELRHYYNLTFPQIATLLKIDTLTVTNIHHRARNYLRNPKRNPYCEELHDLYKRHFGRKSFDRPIDWFSEGLSRTGLRSFKNTGLSSVELAAQKHMDYENYHKRKQNGRSISS